ncbi:MAG TPA: lipoprotein insertase outer membrane protein LolB [Steroidobacteraceae bacterium]|nr:lipoprotein insertase outer membrane protein LolB [Steroidobacteraceae bacterium]
MRPLYAMLLCVTALAGCATMRHEARPAGAPLAWNQRIAQLEQATSWQLQGRAAAALGQQGWQASLDWRQKGPDSDLHLSGPLGVGATEIKMTPTGLSLNGAPPSDTVMAQLQDKLGFELPLDNLRYWLLGIPDPSVPFDLTRNAQDRAQRLSQAGWTIDYDQYMPANGDLLPKRLVLNRAAARVRIAVDHWQGLP